MTSSTDSKQENSPVDCSGITVEELTPTLIVKLHCGCTMIESVNAQQTETSLQLWRASTCVKLRHFTAHESGWPQLVDARKATIVHSVASLEKYGAHGVT